MEIIPQNSGFGELQDALLYKKISVLIDGLKAKEAYTGVCVRLDRFWLTLDMSFNGKYNRIDIKTKHVLSILRYTNQVIY